MKDSLDSIDVCFVIGSGQVRCGIQISLWVLPGKNLQISYCLLVHDIVG